MELLEYKEPLKLELAKDKGAITNLPFNQEVIPLSREDGDGVVVSICSDYLVALRKVPKKGDLDIFRDTYKIISDNGKTIIERIKMVNVLEEECSNSSLFKLGEVY